MVCPYDANACWVDFFSIKNPFFFCSTLYELGGDALSREFSETVKKYGR